MTPDGLVHTQDFPEPWEPRPEIIAWLIEDPGSHPGKFWLPNVRTGVDWTDDANKAVRFLRHNDANEVISTRPNINELWVARKHVWFSDAAVEESRALAARPAPSKEPGMLSTHLGLLRVAILAGDPKKELLLRVDDMEKLPEAARPAEDGLRDDLMTWFRRSSWQGTITEGVILSDRIYAVLGRGK
jgi:hypothetical protein